MVHLVGGVEAYARYKQYEYRPNSLISDTHTPISDPESLRGKIDFGSFGGHAERGKAAELDEKIKKSKKKERDPRSEAALSFHAKKRRLRDENTEEGVYQPTTKETMAAYEAMLSIIQRQLGGQPLNIVSAAADEILALLKNEAVKTPDKKKEIHKLLYAIDSYVFDQLVNIGNLITDYRDGAGPTTASCDDDLGVAVESDEDEVDESDLDAVPDDLEDVAEPNGSGAMQMGGAADDEEMMEAKQGMTLSVQDIDAYWLQRNISQEYHQQIDTQQCQELAEEVLKVLALEDVRDVERKLVYKLEHNKFNLVNFLLRNRVKIVWCTRLARAKDQDERKEIEDEMMNWGPDLVAILEQLHATRATAIKRQKDLEKSIGEEACQLRDDSGDLIRDADCGRVTGQPQLLDLESLASEPDLFMANIRCVLPLGSSRHPSEGYEEVRVPPLKPRPTAPDDKLVNIADMPDWAHPAFKGMQQLNWVQSRVYETALFKADNILLCAPFDAGKINVVVLTILQQIALNRNPDGSFNHSNYKIVYVAPMKTLVAEIVGNLSSRLGAYGVNVKELNGDQTLTRQQIEETQIIVTTPEKWDIVTRKSGDRTYTQFVKLLIIDEIHLLHDNRGPVLESIVARTVRQIETTKEHIRLVGLSATLPNYEDVALFLRVDVEKGLFHFDNSYRPVPLSQKYIGITVKKPLQRFQLMNDICYEKVMSVAGKHQVLIFVHSRKETENTARAIRDSALANDTLGRFLKEDSASREILQSHTDMVKSNDLKDLLPYGFAIHHAGMTRVDRQLVEDLFANGHVQALVSTATLAWGVNLHAHTVIIKGTQIYNPEKGAWTELSPLDATQMLGHAGKPQFDSSAEGIIITGHSELPYYLSLMNQQLPIESRLISKLADQLNAEIVLGAVQNSREACNWLGYTYLYVRMLRNPTLYGLAPDVVTRDITLDERRSDLIHSAATILDKSNLVKYDRKSGYFRVTDLGRIASYYCITHGTISTYNEHLKPTMGYIELSRLFSLSGEFKYMTVRQDEKMELVKLLDLVLIPINESLEEPSAKINVLVQAYISQLKLEGFPLTSDMVFITQTAGRLMRALFEIALKRGWAQLAIKALNLCNMVNRRMWSVQTPLRQFQGMPNETLRNLEKEYLPWERCRDLSPKEIGELIRLPKMGRILHKFIHLIPKLNLAAEVQPVTRTVLRIELTITPDFQWEDKVHGYMEPFWVIVEDNHGEYILHHEYFLLKKQCIDEDHTLNFIVPISEPWSPQYFIRVVSDKWVGSQSVLPVTFKHLILPEKYPTLTELLELQPVPRESVEKEKGIVNMAKATDGVVYRQSKSCMTVIDLTTGCEVDDEYSHWPPPVHFDWFRHGKAALSYYEKQQDAEFELVGLYPYSYKSLVYIPEIYEKLGNWIHISFIVVPKGTVAEDVASQRLVFAEMFVCGREDPIITHCSTVELNDPGISYGCGLCDPRKKIPHSSSGYLMGHWTYENGEIPDSAYESHWFKEEIVGSSKSRRLDVDKLFKGKAPREFIRRRMTSFDYAEIVLKLHKKGEDDAELEVVKGLGHSRRKCLHVPEKSNGLGEWVHVSFLAKPKNVEDALPKLFFGELYDYGSTKEYSLSMCCILETNDPAIGYECGFCEPEKKIAHAPNHLAGHWPYRPPGGIRF